MSNVQCGENTGHPNILMPICKVIQLIHENPHAAGGTSTRPESMMRKNNNQNPEMLTL